MVDHGYFVFLAMIAAWIGVGCQSESGRIEMLPEKAVAVLELEKDTLLISEFAGDLDIPWDISIGGDGWIWFTEQKGTVSRIHSKSKKKELLLDIADVHFKKSRGLTSMALHPDFADLPYVYLHYTYAFRDSSLLEKIESRLVRYELRSDTLVDPYVLLDSIPGNTYHNGSCILIVPDKKLFLSTGDAGNASGARNPDLLSGKILRMDLDGGVPNDNPIRGSYVWSWGHRNGQGLAWANGKLYESEHGPNNDDEINWIRKANNYGWNIVEGFCDRPREISSCKEYDIAEPLFSWTPTLGISGLAYYRGNAISEWENSLIVSSLKGRSIRVLKLDTTGEQILDEKIYFQKIFGRIRDIEVSDDGSVYFSTSNNDWHPRYQPWMYDSLPPGADRILKITPINHRAIQSLSIKEMPVLKEDPNPMGLLPEDWNIEVNSGELDMGEELYLVHCASCHLQNGEGVEELTPPLVDTDWVTGDKYRLIRSVLNGLSGPLEVNGITYNEEMPAYHLLEDEEIAAILNYVRTNFGNFAGGVTAAEVADER